jgi:Protein of unknown function (DUF3618)
MSDASSDLEHEAEASRRRLARLLDELRFRVSPGEVVERLVRDANRDGVGSQFLRTLREQVRSNPIACMLIAAGITWMMVSDLQKNRRALRGNELRALAPRRSPARQSAARMTRPRRRTKPRKRTARRA